MEMTWNGILTKESIIVGQCHTCYSKENMFPPHTNLV